MPRAPRVDAPGLFHHLVVRGVERRTIFVDDRDRLDLLARLDRILPDSGLSCLAWALIPNHFHLVVRTGPTSISRVMARLGTGYARRFNERHGRVGHLFQNRFRSRVIDDDADLGGVVRYVHLNPLKHGLVATLDALGSFPWCGHRAVLGLDEPRSFHDVPRALSIFDPTPIRARERLLATMRDGAEMLHRERAGPSLATTERAENAAVDEAAGDGDALMELVSAAADALSVGRRELMRGSLAKPVVRARAVVAFRAHVELGIPVARLVALLGISDASVRRAIESERRRRAALPARAGLALPAPNAGPSPSEGQ